MHLRFLYQFSENREKEFHFFIQLQKNHMAEEKEQRNKNKTKQENVNMDEPCHNSRYQFFFWMSLSLFLPTAKFFFLLGRWWLVNKTNIFVVKAVTTTQTYKSGIVLWFLVEHSLTIVLNFVHQYTIGVFLILCKN